jgi:16S rRNA (guanine527-N7)-methyltransferase
VFVVGSDAAPPSERFDGGTAVTAGTDDARMELDPAEAVDPLDGDPRLPIYFGDAWPAVSAFHDMLVSEGVLRGLIGPREASRLWARHLLNSATVVEHLPARGRIVDVGSGAGLPGVVVAAMLPEAEVVLLEPMERRTDWLVEVTRALRLSNAVVRRGRAQDVEGDLIADAVTSRAVASLDKLDRWCVPLLGPGAALVVLKGEKAQAEVDAAATVGRRIGLAPAQVLAGSSIDGVEATHIVRAVREEPRRVR